ncbi:MAG: GIY-YIG nuclease family protein [Patescibacteria group bacterium]
MYTVYIIQSEIDHRYYYGFSGRSILDRLREHNEGKSCYTSQYRPWKLIWHASFSSKTKAKDFERYLKTPSGYAFSRKRLI